MKTKKITKFRSKIRSRHPSHDILRGNIRLLPFKSIVRLGSTTDEPDTVTNGGRRIECNTIEAVQTASNKLRMKRAFNDNEVKTADWYTIHEIGGGHDIRVEFNPDLNISLSELTFPIIAKHIYGSRNNGNVKLDTLEELEDWIPGKTLSNYIFEKFYNYSREYRLHVTSDGCFYTCRKMLKRDVEEDQRWFRNDSNSVWMIEDNELFDKPVNWDDVIEHSARALNAVGLDIGAVDLKIQSRFDSKDRVRESPDFIVLEINSAPSFGEITAEKYINEIPKVLIKKHNS